MNQDIINFVKANKIAIISILRPDGSIHAAAIHFSSNEDGTEFYIATHKNSRKVERLLSGEAVKSSMVIGFNEAEMITLQMDGTAEIISEEEKLTPVKEIHYAMHPFAKKFEGNPDTVFLMFKPEWWRYSEFMAKPPVFIESK